MTGLMAHIIVDGYNFIRCTPLFLEEEREGLKRGREALLIALEAYGARNSYRITAVFDGGGRPGYENDRLPVKDKFAGIDVVFSRRGQSADDAILEILDLSSENAEFALGEVSETIVVTDDLGLKDEAIARGSYVKSALDLFISMQEGRPIEY
jgi:predicted RNA-binding protein with PIN domain